MDELDSEPELSDPKYRFKERVSRLMRMHNRTKKEAEEIVTTVIRTKENDSIEHNSLQASTVQTPNAGREDVVEAPDLCALLEDEVREDQDRN